MPNIITMTRIPKDDIERIDILVKTSCFLNRSDFVRHAIKKLLEEIASK